MFVPNALRWLLPLLAVLGLALAPVTASAAAQRHASVPAHAMSMAGMDMAHMSHSDMALDGSSEEAMPCCPHWPGGMPDCAKDCPMMALCVAKVAAGVPAGIGLPLRTAAGRATSWEGDAPFVSLAQAPPPEPPRS